jgi:hypothetical protein
VFKPFDNKVRARIAGQELDIAEAVVGKWFALAFAYDAATGAFESYVDGGFVCHGHLPVYGRPYLMRLLGDQLREHTARISHAAGYAKADFRQHGPSTSRRTDALLRVQEPHDPLWRATPLRTLASEEYGRYVTGERGHAGNGGAFAQADTAFRPRTMKAHALFIFTGLARASALTVLTNLIPTSSRAVASVVVRVQVNSGDQSAGYSSWCRRQAIRWV